MGGDWTRDGRKLLVDPTDQVFVSNIADEQKEAVSGLIEPTIAQAMTGQGAAIEVLRFRTGEASLVIAAAVELPIAL